MQQMPNSILSWINWTKVICLFLVYFYHSETRSHFHVGIVDIFFRPFFVNAFFIISGYLIFKKQLNPQIRVLRFKNWYKQYGNKFLNNVFFRIAIPTILFGTFLFVPKILMRGGGDLSLFVRQSIGGCGLWFTPALTIAELLLFCVFLVRITSPYIIFFLSIIVTLLASWLNLIGVEGYPWYYQTGMCSTLFLSIGGIYFDIENKIYQFKNIECLFLVSIFFYFIMCFFVPPIRLSVMKISFLGFFCSVLASLSLIHYMKKLPQNKIIDRIGNHTLGMYFLSGAIPEVLCAGIKKNTNFDDVTIILIALVSFAIGIVVNELLVRFFPFLFDLRVQKK